jgi:hypothetical protein
MQYEAARVLRDANGKEQAEAPQRFTTYQQAADYIKDTPVCDNRVRPWIRDTAMLRDEFLVIGGTQRWMPTDANECSNGGRHGQLQ